MWASRTRRSSSSFASLSALLSSFCSVNDRFLLSTLMLFGRGMGTGTGTAVPFASSCCLCAAVSVPPPVWSATTCLTWWWPSAPVGPCAEPFTCPFATTPSLLTVGKGRRSPFAELVELLFECVREWLCTTLDMAFLMDDMVEREVGGEDASMLDQGIYAICESGYVGT